MNPVKTLDQIVILTCNRCGHNWLRRMAHDPAQCSACHSPYWNRERVRAVNAKRKPPTKQGGKKRKRAA